MPIKAGCFKKNKQFQVIQFTLTLKMLSYYKLDGQPLIRGFKHSLK
ncbi:hypothetical protein UWK_01291 [Desulfocapsa sulfexigens DSM 10523]|uniref:Uncharacterized protein n=1 Tax=Desulfocapsa sulfexigens (strain DSM 10523 / SB164P1) TaxID=1167006 RepID=M1P848_DESSD|nr:hypothetical protein UWK_01291 [Desulfocapsa sulfexigens DSM 10523]